MEKLAYTIDQFAKAAGLGRTTVYQLIGAAEIERVKVGRRSLITAASAAAFFERLPRS